MLRQLRRVLIATLAVALALVPTIPVAAAPSDGPVSVAVLLDRLVGWLGWFELGYKDQSFRSEASPFMDPDGLNVPAPEEGQAQEAPDDSQDAMPHMDPDG